MDELITMRGKMVLRMRWAERIKVEWLMTRVKIRVVLRLVIIFERW
jgi:hypothetical protein